MIMDFHLGFDNIDFGFPNELALPLTLKRSFDSAEAAAVQSFTEYTRLTS